MVIWKHCTQLQEEESSLVVVSQQGGQNGGRAGGFWEAGGGWHLVWVTCAGCHPLQSELTCPKVLGQFQGSPLAYGCDLCIAPYGVGNLHMPGQLRKVRMLERVMFVK